MKIKDKKRIKIEESEKVLKRKVRGGISCLGQRRYSQGPDNECRIEIHFDEALRKESKITLICNSNACF